MIRCYGSSFFNLRLPRWNVRCVSSDVLVRPTRRKRGRPRSDEDETKKQYISRKRRTQRDNIQEDGASVSRKRAQTPLEPSATVVTPTTRHTDFPKTTKRSARTTMFQRLRTGAHKAFRVPSVLLASTRNHHDLPSFLLYSINRKLDPTSNVYKGTLYEYTVLEALKAYNFDMVRTGQTKDGGVDLAGQWRLPEIVKKLPHKMNTIVQCKNCNPRPGMVRELEGSFTDGPADWRGTNIFRLLVANGKSTKGVLAAVRGSLLPMGFMYATPEGQVKQFFWNDAATRAGLEGMVSTLEYSEVAIASKAASGKEVRVLEGRIALMWNGEGWPPKKPKRSRKAKA